MYTYVYILIKPLSISIQIGSSLQCPIQSVCLRLERLIISLKIYPSFVLLVFFFCLSAHTLKFTPDRREFDLGPFFECLCEDLVRECVVESSKPVNYKLVFSLLPFKRLKKEKKKRERRTCCYQEKVQTWNPSRPKPESADYVLPAQQRP